MTDVNPNSRAAFVTPDGRLTRYGMEVLGDIYKAINLVGGLSDLDNLAQRASMLQYQERVVWDVVEVAANYTTRGNEFISATGTLTITLDEGPVTIEHAGDYTDVVTVTDGTGYDKLIVPGTKKSYFYSVDLDRWI